MPARKGARDGKAAVTGNKTSRQKADAEAESSKKKKEYHYFYCGIVYTGNRCGRSMGHYQADAGGAS